MKSDKKPISMRGRVAMLIVGLIGFVYWLIGKIEVIVATTIQENRTEKKEL